MSLPHSFENCLVFPADNGFCSGQEQRIVLEAEVEKWTSLSDEKSHTLAVACFLILLHRHTNQASVCVGRWSHDTGLQPAAYEFEGNVDVEEIIAALSQNPLHERYQIDEDRRVPTMICFGDRTACDEICRQASLAISWENVASSISVRLAFDGKLFLASRMQEFLDQYLLLANQVFASPQGSISGYSLVTRLGKQILPDPSEEIIAPRYPLLSEVFLAVSASSPDDTAVTVGGKNWTYAQLEQSSAKLAGYLCSTGIQRGNVVAVSGPRSFGVVSTILGVFRSGATLLTIDPKLPLERQVVILQQAGAKTLVRVGEPCSIDASVESVIPVDPDSGQVIGGELVALGDIQLPVLDPAAAAYIFFTSGSTGIPKGVVGSHRGLAHFLDWQRKTFGIGPGDRAAQITTLSFDMVLRDMFLALTSGATLCIPQESDVLDPKAILNWMASERISILHVVPSLLRAWINNAPSGLLLPDLRRVFLAGEPLTEALILSFRAAFGDKALLTNFYGPTETTLIKCFHPVIQVEAGLQPIGRPQPETQILILNRSGKLCGVNEIGEIAIRTPFRTLGYLNAPEATAKVFVANPFRSDADDLLYLTGDSGCYRTDGLLTMRGRMDDQVKIRGMRVEPAEIEAAIGRCPGVREAAVVARENSNGIKYLTGYIVPEHGGRVPAAEAPITRVREFLLGKLPENMVPSEFVVLDSLPLLPNGKVDKKALKSIESSSGIQVNSRVDMKDGPKTSREAELLEIWKSVLGHDRVSVHDSFVELGGDSLTAISALVRMQRLGIADSYARGIFQGWSIRQIADMSDGLGDQAATLAMQPRVRTNLFVNVLRGILVVILVTGHWFEGLLNRLPASLHGLQEILMPLFNVATPGFAILFGLSLGYIYFPRYLTDRKQCVRALYWGALLVFAGVLLRGGISNSTDLLSGKPFDSTQFFNNFYSAILYYALALLSVPLWFRLLASASKVYRRILLMMAASYFLYHGALWLFLAHEQHGFIQLCRLMLVAKFNYFNMSMGALGGVAAGIYLYRWSLKKLPLQELAGRLAGAGVAAVAVGLVLLYGETGGFHALHDAAIMPVWKWIFYAGTLLLSASLLSRVLTLYEHISRHLRISINTIGVLGQISLPVFVFHNMVLEVKALLIFWGMNSTLALVLPLLVFLAGCAWVMLRLYDLYYGEIGSRQNALMTAEALL